MPPREALVEEEEGKMSTSSPPPGGLVSVSEIAPAERARISERLSSPWYGISSSVSTGTTKARPSSDDATKSIPPSRRASSKSLAPKTRQEPSKPRSACARLEAAHPWPSQSVGPSGGPFRLVLSRSPSPTQEEEMEPTTAPFLNLNSYRPPVRLQRSCPPSSISLAPNLASQEPCSRRLQSDVLRAGIASTGLADTIQFETFQSAQSVAELGLPPLTTQYPPTANEPQMPQTGGSSGSKPSSRATSPPAYCLQGPARVAAARPNSNSNSKPSADPLPVGLEATFISSTATSAGAARRTPGFVISNSNSNPGSNANGCISIPRSFEPSGLSSIGSTNARKTPSVTPPPSSTSPNSNSNSSPTFPPCKPAAAARSSSSASLRVAIAADTETLPWTLRTPSQQRYRNELDQLAVRAHKDNRAGQSEHRQYGDEQGYCRGCQERAATDLERDRMLDSLLSLVQSAIVDESTGPSLDPSVLRTRLPLALGERFTSRPTYTRRIPKPHVSIARAQPTWASRGPARRQTMACTGVGYDPARLGCRGYPVSRVWAPEVVEGEEVLGWNGVPAVMPTVAASTAHPVYWGAAPRAVATATNGVHISRPVPARPKRARPTEACEPGLPKRTRVAAQA